MTSSYIVVNIGPGLTTHFLMTLARQGWLVSSPADANHLRRQIVHLGPPVVIIYRESQLTDPEKTLILDLKKRGRTRLIAVIDEAEESPAEEHLWQQVDDFMIWPVSEAELMLRVRRLMPSKGYTNGAESRATRETSLIEGLDDDWRYRLSPVERQIVRHLQEAQGEVVPLAELIKHVTGESESMQTNALRVYINRLRSKIHAFHPHAPRIVNVRGVGYRIETN
jgi:DNA-binding response OmpR family regulator